MCLSDNCEHLAFSHWTVLSAWLWCSNVIRLVHLFRCWAALLWYELSFLQPATILNSGCFVILYINSSTSVVYTEVVCGGSLDFDDFIVYIFFLCLYLGPCAYLFGVVTHICEMPIHYIHFIKVRYIQLGYMNKAIMTLPWLSYFMGQHATQHIITFVALQQWFPTFFHLCTPFYTQFYKLYPLFVK